MLTPATLSQFLTSAPTVVAEVTAVRGSSPRSAGTFMVVSEGGTLGTVGGGALEYLVIARARQVLAGSVVADDLEVPLGPELGQCCGGKVSLALRVVDEVRAEALIARVRAEVAARPHLYMFGAGHVGHALARALVLLPLHVHVIDTRPDELTGLPEGVEAKAVAMPEAVVRNAPQGSAYVILTHDHALDFLIAGEALRRDDAPYVGMVGSRTKRQKFASWYRAEGGSDAALARLVLPIGGDGYGDKRPEVIAALAAAEIMVHIARREAEKTAGPVTTGALGTAYGR